MHKNKLSGPEQIKNERGLVPPPRDTAEAAAEYVKPTFTTRGIIPYQAEKPTPIGTDQSGLVTEVSFEGKIHTVISQGSLVEIADTNEIPRRVATRLINTLARLALRDKIDGFVLRENMRSEGYVDVDRLHEFTEQLKIEPIPKISNTASELLLVAADEIGQAALDQNS